MTETRVRLVHFDRAGASVTPWFNYHEDPRTFVRLVLGLTSPKESVLGLDTSIKWEIDPDTQRKSSGSISCPDAKGKSVKYEMKSVAPEFRCHSIRGRGTTCWRVIDPKDKKTFVIKDAWRTGTRISESVYLTAASGAQGVVKMIMCKDNLATTDSVRPISYVGTSTYEGRIKLRIVMEAHGQSILHFQSRYQLVSALRDAVRGESTRFLRYA